MKELFLINGCKLKCNCGSVVTELKVTSQNFEHVENKLQATEGDKKVNENIFPFGACSLRRRKPCMPQPLEWEGKIDWDKIDSKATLTNKSTLKCIVGGVISVLDAGQSWYGLGKSEEGTSQTNTLAEYVTAKDPIKNIYEIDKDGNINPVEEDTAKDKDIIYISDNFTGTGSNRKLKPTHDGGFEVGEKGYIDKNKGSYGGNDFIKFKDFDKAYNLFHWIAEKAGTNVMGKESFPIIVEFSLQGIKGRLISVLQTPNKQEDVIYIVTTKHNEGTVSVLDGRLITDSSFMFFDNPPLLFDVHFHPGQPGSPPSGLNKERFDWEKETIDNPGTYDFSSGGDMGIFGLTEKDKSVVPPSKNSYMYNYTNQKFLQYGHGGLLKILSKDDFKKEVEALNPK